MHPDKVFDDAPTMARFKEKLAAEPPITPEDAAAINIEARVEPGDNAFNGALFTWAYMRDVHLIRGSVVEMDHPEFDIDPVDVKRTGKKTGKKSGRKKKRR